MREISGLPPGLQALREVFLPPEDIAEAVPVRAPRDAASFVLSRIGFKIEEYHRVVAIYGQPGKSADLSYFSRKDGNDFFLQARFNFDGSMENPVSRVVKVGEKGRGRDLDFAVAFQRVRLEIMDYQAQQRNSQTA